MGKLGNIFGVLTLICAITAAVFTYMLADRRDEFRGRADKIATTLTEVTAQLDAEDQTGTKGKVSFTAGDPSTKKEETGTLGWKAYHEAKDESGSYAAFDAPLKAAVELAQGANTQRTELADSMTEVADSLKADKDWLQPEGLKNLGDKDRFDATRNKVTDLAKYVAERDSDLVNSYVKNAREIGITIRAADFYERHKTEEQNTAGENETVLKGFRHADSVKKFSDRLVAVNDRSTRMVTAMQDGIKTINKYNWNVRSNDLASDTKYKAALIDIKSDFKKINSQLVQLEKTKKELEKAKEDLNNFTEELDIAREQLTKTKNYARSLESELKKLTNNDTDALAKIAESMDEGPVKMAEDLQGKVIEIDNSFNYIVVDLGAREIEENTRMLVARGDKLIASVIVTKILGKISIADILSDAITDKVQIGDRVILPAKKVEEKADANATLGL